LDLCQDNNQNHDPELNTAGQDPFQIDCFPFDDVKEVIASRKDGSQFPMELTFNRLRSGQDEYFTATVRDITEAKVLQQSLWISNDELESRVEQRTIELVESNIQLKEHINKHKGIHDALEVSRQRLKTIITNAPVILFAVDENGVFSLSEGKGLARLGLKPGGLVGRSAFELFEHIPQFDEDFQKVLRGEEVSPLLEINDLVFECWFSVVREENGEVSGIIGVATDITERKRAEKRLVQLANYDSLTGLPNRTLFRDRLAHAVAQANRKNRLVALLFLDLDRFKMINDSLGHLAGDELLKAVSGRLLANAREEDTVARLGGDEFTVILEDITNTEDATIVARKILEVMGKPFYLDGHEVFVTTSIGIAIFPLDGQGLDGLLKNADTAMYRAKEQGRNNYQFYTADMNAKAVEHLIMESSLRHALDRDEFVLHFQPQIDLHSREITGMEVLLRWNHPELGLLYPNQFMLLAEETGLIISIGEWVLSKACAQAALWQSQGLPPMRIAVNLSALQFREDNLVATVADVLDLSELDPQYLELEITESFLMDNVDSAIAKLRALSNLGVHLAIDDFGTGYSSLSYLKKFPLNTLKIDQSFVRDISTDPDDAAIAEAIIALAKTLNLRVMAEGVETEEQINFLRTRGCDQAQGFLISHPVPAQDILPWCQETSENRFAFDQGLLWPGHEEEVRGEL
jgi:diguanylate cyclase (GGDEF)-like protein/PAS domain S-box-containing protein